METVVTLKHVDVRRGGKPILSNIDWTIGPKENWVILGPNGAGKTTLINLLTGRVFPSYSKDSNVEAKILGYKLGEVDVRELRTYVGLSSSAERSLIRPEATVEDLVLSSIYGKTGRGREEYEQQDVSRAHDLMHLFGIEALADRKFSTLSAGEQQRTQICRALMADPQILILDEPVAGLDLGARELLMLALEEIAKDPRSPALVLITHHLEQIPKGFTHAALMKNGSIIGQGPLHKVLTDEQVSDAFGLPLRVGEDNGRWWGRAE